MTRIYHKEIKQKFVQGLADRRFLGKDYAIYLYSIPKKNGAENKYELKLDAFATTSDFNEQNGFPLPNKPGRIRNVPYERYQAYKFGRGGEALLCGSIYNDEPSLAKSKLVKKSKHWIGRPAYFTGYNFEDIRLVIFLIFDYDPIDKVEKELEYIYINPVLRSVEDVYHKNQIFKKNYLDLLLMHIDKKIFRIARKSIVDVLQYDYTYSRYLLKIYYKFLFGNFKMFGGRLEDDQKKKLLELSREFETNQKILFRIPFYRDHFFHQCNVYLLGLAIISILINSDFDRNLVNDFNESYRPMNEFETDMDVTLVWFIASLFHDISYPVEKSGQWLDAFFKQYIYPKKYHKHILKIDLNISRVVSDRAFNQCIEDLAEYHRRLLCEENKISYRGYRLDENIQKACNIRSTVIDQIIDFRDHGVLSAIMLLDRFDRLDTDLNIFKYLFPAAAAISIHNFLWIDENEFQIPCKSCDKVDSGCTSCKDWKNAYDKYFSKQAELWFRKNADDEDTSKQPDLRFTEFAKDPAGFLLILCDTLQDWGRYDFENLKHAYDEFYNQSSITDIRVEDENIVFDLSVTPVPDSEEEGSGMNFLLYKKQEIVKVFSRLKFIEGHDIVVNLIPKDGDEVSFSMNAFD